MENQLLSVTSARPVDIVAGCIGERWLATDELMQVASVKTGTGWLITSRDKGMTFGVAEVVPEGQRTMIRYSSGWINWADKFHIPAVKACV